LLQRRPILLLLFLFLFFKKEEEKQGQTRTAASAQSHGTLKLLISGKRYKKKEGQR